MFGSGVVGVHPDLRGATGTVDSPKVVERRCAQVASALWIPAVKHYTRGCSLGQRGGCHIRSVLSRLCIKGWSECFEFT